MVGPDVSGMPGERLPLGRAVECPGTLSVQCPAQGLAAVDWYRNNPRRMPHMRLGVVGAVFDTDGRVLLTRRASRMRSFPGSWVMPGGGLDPDESMADAVAREVREETGIVLDEDSVRPVGLWESVYPTSTADCIAGGTGITAHYFVVFYAALARVHRPEVTLQTEETDLAVWLSADQLAETLAHPRGGASGTVDVAASARGGQRSILLDELAGIYPRPVTSPIDSGREEDVPGVGIAQGNLFILSELLRESKQGTSTSMFFGLPGTATPKL
eukprot:COSAG02_NODE_135_length_34565_cov_80.368856_8_plen_272_part_00